MLDKEMLFKEFEIEKEKDLKLSTSEYPREEVHKHRLEYLKQHAAAKKSNPSLYANLDVDFNKFIEMYSSPSPVDYFYKKVFNMTYDMYLEQKRLAEMLEGDDEETATVN